MGFFKDTRDAQQENLSFAPGWDVSRAPLFGQFFRSPQEGQAIKTALESTAQTQQYRPAQQEGYQNLLGNVLSPYQAYNKAMGRVYGASAMQDLSAQTPVTEGMTSIGPSPEMPEGVSRENDPFSPVEEVGTGWALGGPIGGLIAGRRVRKERRQRRRKRRAERRERRRRRGGD